MPTIENLGGMPKNFRDYFLSLPIEQKAGFFLWPSLESIDINKDEEKLLQKIKPSGMIFFKRNLSNLTQAKNLISQVQNLCEKKKSPFSIPLITSIDEEGGRVSRLPPPFIRGKPALEFADKNDKEGLINQILHQTFVAKGIGINCLLAPVADILTEPNNPVMGDRCFGRDASTVSEYACIVNKTILKEGLFSCAKHFPGHGNTVSDSHKEISVSNVSLDVLKNREWLPFQKLISENVPFMMAAHVLVPQLDASNPATLSYKILTEYLQNSLNFKGLILSDDLRMNAIALHYNITKKQESSITEEENTLTDEDDFYLKQAAIDALYAGCDILLSCQSITREKIIIEAISEKLKNNEIFLEKMIEKAWKIYTMITSKKVH